MKKARLHGPLRFLKLIPVLLVIPVLATNPLERVATTFGGCRYPSGTDGMLTINEYQRTSRIKVMVPLSPVSLF